VQLSKTLLICPILQKAAGGLQDLESQKPSQKKGLQKLLIAKEMGF
jgi:hypothetical protein